MQPLGVEQPDSIPDLIIPRDRGNSWFLFLVTLGLVIPALVINVFKGVMDVAAMLAVVGLPIVYWTGRNAIMNPPLLRVSEQGLRFGGGNLVPWVAVKMIRECNGDVAVRGMLVTTSSISIYFCQAKTIFQLPLSHWIVSVLSNGDIDVSILATKQSARVVAAQLDARKTHALGAENAVTAGAAALPAARIHHQD